MGQAMRIKVTKSVSLRGVSLITVPDSPGVVEVAEFKGAVQSRNRARQ